MKEERSESGEGRGSGLCGGLVEGHAEERGVGVAELEEEGFEDERVFVVCFGAVVLQIVEQHCHLRVETLC